MSGEKSAGWNEPKRLLASIDSRFIQGEEISREEIAQLVASIRLAESRLLGPRSRSKSGDGAIWRLRDYFVAHVGEELPGEVLREIAGIQEWARRVRELRIEHGYDISELGRSSYRLESPSPNIARAKQWQTANAIRRQGGSAIGRIEELFLQNVGEVLNREQLDYVARIKEGSRRVRELRDEQGWPINSHVDEPELRPGEYRLVSASLEDRRDTSQRLYPEDLRHRVFERDRFTCQACNRNRQTADAAGDSRFYLEVHHRAAVADDVAKLTPEELNSEANLITLCHACHRNETALLQERRRLTRRGG